MVLNNDISNAELIQMFKTESPATIRTHASTIRRKIKNKELEINKISIETIEPIILKLINKNPNTHNIKLAMDLIKAKIADRGMEDDLVIDKFVKKALTTIRSQDKDDYHDHLMAAMKGKSTPYIPLDEDLTHNDSDKQLEENMKSSIKSISSLLNDPEEYE